jgi:DNA-binding response OmpR family regulator
VPGRQVSVTRCVAPIKERPICYHRLPLKLLVIEDSERLRASIARGLRKSGYAVDVAADGWNGLILGRARDYDVIVLDLILPKLDGLAVLEKLRAEKVPTPVLILTALDKVEDRVRGLRLGGDDYLVKPFAFDELVARIEALVRRRYGDQSPKLVAGDVEIDPAARRVTCRGTELRLSAREYTVLEYLARRQGSVVSRSEIDEHVYEDRRPIASNAIDSAICLLRQKLAAAGSDGLIQTRKGLGYVLGAAAPLEPDRT